MQEFGRDRVESGHRADIVDRSKMTRCGSGMCIAAVEGDCPDRLLDDLVGAREHRA